ncbi:hypothetical protein JB92DRAFT_3063382 [Gautieria morchelliformis]|nr:hypothetical protein JB92DRAFT_3063382 [Gautieria morchelliformis]
MNLFVKPELGAGALVALLRDRLRTALDIFDQLSTCRRSAYYLERVKYFCTGITSLHTLHALTSPTTVLVCPLVCLSFQPSPALNSTPRSTNLLLRIRQLSSFISWLPDSIQVAPTLKSPQPSNHLNPQITSTLKSPQPSNRLNPQIALPQHEPSRERTEVG